MGFILYLIANLLALILVPVSIIFDVVRGFRNHHVGTGLKTADHKFKLWAVAFDEYGNVICSELFNATLITSKSVHRFGQKGITISSIVGDNYVAGTLSTTGKVLCFILRKFNDPDIPVLPKA